MDYEEELAAALEAAVAAGRMVSAAYRDFQAIPDAPASITTQVDRDAQELILDHLRSVFPNDALCAEEDTPTLATATRHGRRVWIVDPIDGTRGFAVKNGEFSIMVGLAIEGEVVVGVVAEPAVRRITYASRHGGCWTSSAGGAFERCRVTATATLGDSTLVQSHSKPGRANPVREIIAPGQCVETYSAGVKLAMVARGEVDLYVNDYANFRDWDICAGHLLVEEAGGTVSDIHGNKITYGKPDFSQRGGLLADNGLLHAEAVERLKGLKI